MRRRSTTLEARATLSAGFGSGSVRRGGRGETLGADGAGFPGAPQLRGGEWPDGTRRAGASCPPGLQPAGGGVRPSRPVAAFPCADCLARPGLALGCRGLECEVARPSLPAFLRSRAAPSTASPFVLLAALCPFPPFPALRATLLSACLPRLLRRCFTPATSRSPWLAGAGRVKAETAPRFGVPEF